MSCNLNNGYIQTCKSIAGIKEIYIGELDSNVVYHYNNNNEIDSITNIQEYYKIEVQIETASFLQTGGFSNENGTAYYTKTIEFTLHGMIQSLSNFIKILGIGGWSVIFKDQTDQYWLLDPKNRINVTNSTPGVGKAFGDLNGAVITMETKGIKPATIISGGFDINGFVITHQQSEINYGDLYYAGIFTYDLQSLSSSNKLYSNDLLNVNYFLPSWVSGNISFDISGTDNPNDLQPIIITYNVINNYGISKFYFRLSDLMTPSTDNENSVIISTY